jgi:hypothetical protein
VVVEGVEGVNCRWGLREGPGIWGPADCLVQNIPHGVAYGEGPAAGAGV